MRQQEANQFDKGLSLDTNAIAMDNHTLSGALNATMITMNGNELVLQNDMGNAKVESAYLPSGYVPVGMQEFGGIVYVASYNPFDQTSQIGCFPSPETNRTSDEDGAPQAGLGNLFPGNNQEITTISSRIQLIKGPIRPGDKFVIASTSMDAVAADVAANLISFKVLAIDDTGTGVDITDSMKRFDGGILGFIAETTDLNSISEDKFTTYSNKISSSIWLQESIIVPAYITVSITATELNLQNEPDTVEVTFTAAAYDSEGNPWTLNAPGFKYVITGGTATANENVVRVNRWQNKVLTYSIKPTYKDSPVAALEQTGSIDVDYLGTGRINIPSVRYYNDTTNDQLTLDYTINAYVENSEHRVTSVNLEFYDYNDLTVVNRQTDDGAGSITLNANKKQTISLSTSNIFGSYTTVIPYAKSIDGAGKLLKGHLYLARIVAKRVTGDGDNAPSSDYASSWFTLLTSAIANETYMNSPNSGMFEVSSKSTVELDWDINWTEKSLGEDYSDDYPATLNTGTSMPMTAPDNNLIKLQTVRTGKLIRKYKAEVEVDVIDGNFPFDIETSAVISLPDTVDGQNRLNHTMYYTEIETTGGKKDDDPNVSDRFGLLSSNAGTVAAQYLQSETDYDNLVWSETTNSMADFVTNPDNTVERTLHYRAVSQLFAETANGHNSLTFTGSDVPALVPLQTLRVQDDDDIRMMLGGEAFEHQNGNTFDQLRPQAWWVWGTYEGKKDARERIMALMQAMKDYSRSSDYDVTGEIPEQEELTDSGYGLFHTSTTNATWRFYSTVTMDYLHNSLKAYPYLFFWQGCNDSACAMFKGTSNSGNTAYSIPIMTDASGEMFLIGQYTEGADHGNKMLLNVVKCLSRIYVYQQGQTVTYNYYKASDALEDYVYTNPFQIKIESRYKATPTVTFMCGDTQYLGGKFTFEGNTVYLPEFKIKSTSKKGTDEKLFTTYVNAPDQTSKNLEYLDAQPSVGNVAIIKDSDNPAIVGTAVKINSSGQAEGVEPFDISHAYFAYEGSGENTKLCDCTKTLPAVPDYTRGKGIADAINKRYLRVIYSSENEKNILVVNRSTISPVTCNKSDILIGASKRTYLSAIATKHLLKLPLFTDGTNNGTIKNMVLSNS